MNNLPNQSATYTDIHGNQVEDMMFTYSEEERQQNEINRENAKAVFALEYLVIPSEYWSFNKYEMLLASFFRMYGKSNSRIYFSNADFAQMFLTTEATISASINSLKNKLGLKISYKSKAGGGTIRFIELTTSNNFMSDIKKLDALYIKRNKIKRNSIINNTEQNVRYGNIFVNEIGDRFVKLTGQNPIESNWRFLAYALTRKIKSTLKDNGKTVTDDLVLAGISSYFEWLDNQSWSIKKMRTVNEHFETFKAEAINGTAKRREYGK